ATRYQIVADEGETLLLIATFANYAGNAGFNVAGRIEEALEQQIAAAQLTHTNVVVLDEVIGNATKAEAELAAAHAAMLLWGEYDNARVVVNFSVRGDLENPHLRRDLLALDELPTVINRDVPQQVRSLALFALGQLFRGDGQLEQSRTVLENALTLDPSLELRSKIYFYLGSLYGQGTEADLHKAVTAYSEVIALRPADANALYNRGLAYWNLYQLYSNSLDDLDSAIK
ncbi:MAG: tetratricopeptide repeat protein, partial [Caldilineaceae bacterium]|nr:tetratricopeptide repeat protein [Caldilineaceae bacterium]